MAFDKRFIKYFREYQWSNIFAMIKNSKLEPLICDESFQNKLVVITGATSGIGYETAKKYASKGANLLCINRNEAKSQALQKEIVSLYGVSCEYIIADLSRLDDIYRVADALLALENPIDVLIHNAGVYLTQKEVTDDGFEKVFVVHYLSTFIINYLLIDKLKEQSEARIILVNSEGHRFAAWGLNLDDLQFEKRRYSGLSSYGSAKLAQLLSMLVFEEKFSTSNVTINAMHPGAVESETGQENGAIYKWFKNNLLAKVLKPTYIAADALYYLGVSSALQNVTGKFFNLTTLEEPAPPALDIEVGYELWDKSIQLGRLDVEQ